jgi:spermidine dehydrogenase
MIRRDFIGTTLIGAGAALLGASAPAAAQNLTTDWNGYTGIGDYARSNGNTAAVVNAAHGVRDGMYEAAIPSATPVDDLYDLIVVGGGFSGLIAAYEFRKARPNARCLVLDNHAVFGGEAKQNQMLVDGVTLTGPQGSNDAVIPAPDNSYAHVSALWDEIGMPRHFDFVAPTGVDPSLRFARDHYEPMFWDEKLATVGYYFDGITFGSKRMWVTDPWTDDLRRTPLAPEVRQNWLAWKKNARVFTRGNEEQTNRWLDTMSYGDFIQHEMGLSRDVLRLADPLTATGDYGVGSDGISAYAAKLLGLPGVSQNDIGSDAAFAFPGGNAATLRHIVRALIPKAITRTASFTDVCYAPIAFDELDVPQATRIRLSATAVAVRHDGDPQSAQTVSVTYAVDGALQRVRGRAAIIAIGGWIGRHIVRDLPASYVAAYGQFHHAPILVANVAVRNWQAFAKLGITAAHWFDGFGFFVNVRQPMVMPGAPVPLDPAQPTMLTFYVGFQQAGVATGPQASAGRAKLFATSYAEFEHQIRTQMQSLFGDAGFDQRRDIAGIVLNRWGHAYIAPQPGFYFGSAGNPAPLDVIRQRYGRIAFGHSELSGRQSWGRAAQESRRALAQILDATTS